jgi:hypothetical protein
VGIGGFIPGVKLPGSDAGYSPPSSAEVKNAWRYTSITQYIFIAWYLFKYRTRFHGMILNSAQGRSVTTIPN